MSPASSPPRRCRRRTVLAGLGTTVALACGAGATRGAEQRSNRTVAVPAVEEFRNNYEGQFLSILGPQAENTTSIENYSVCSDLPWPPAETQQDVGQLTDRRSESPVAVRVPLYLDAREPDIEEDSLFVINNAEECGDLVILEAVEVTVRSVVGKASGPTVGEQEVSTPGSGGPGFGLLAGAAGIGVLGLRAVLDRAISD